MSGPFPVDPADVDVGRQGSGSVAHLESPGEPMPDFGENDIAIRCARRLIEAGQVVLSSDWNSVRPSAEAQDAFLQANSWEEYSSWHLGVDDDEQYDSKERYGFPAGDFHQVHRSALVHALITAERDGHEEVRQAAEDLLARLERVSGR